MGPWSESFCNDWNFFLFYSLSWRLIHLIFLIGMIGLMSILSKSSCRLWDYNLYFVNIKLRNPCKWFLEIFFNRNYLFSLILWAVVFRIVEIRWLFINHELFLWDTEHFLIQRLKRRKLSLLKLLFLRRSECLLSVL